MQKQKILLVDDEQTTLRLLGNFLDKDYLVTVCSSFKSAVEIYNKKQFDIFLIDITLMDGNGIDLCEMIKKEKKYRFTPVIFISQHDEIDYIRKVFDVGGDDYILKPVNLSELDIRIHRRLNVSKNQKKLLKDYEKLNKQLLELSNEISTNKNDYLLSKNSLSENEKRFKDNSDKIYLNIQNSISFEKKISEMKDKLNQQKNLIDNIKKFLN